MSRREQEMPLIVKQDDAPSLKVILTVVVLVVFGLCLVIGLVIYTVLTKSPPSPPYKLQYSGITFTNDKYCPNVTFGDQRAVESLKNLKSTGANTIALVVTEYMDTANSTVIYPLYTPLYDPNGYYTWVTASLDDLTTIITAAHNLSLKVLLKPHIDPIYDPTQWRGTIGYNFTASMWDEWFQSYTNMTIKYAQLAQRLNVEMYSVSCELVTASRQTDHWRNVTAKIRSIYSGKLTDSANWGGEEVDKRWWNEVDIIGVDAYYPIMNNLTYPPLYNITPALDEVVAAWGPTVDKLANLTRFWNKSLIFAEVGYCASNTNCYFRNANASGTFMNQQAIYYEAVFKAFQSQPWFIGIYWWNWVTDPAFGGLNNPCMTPQFKHAEGILRKYYLATEQQPSPPAYPASCLCTL